MLNILVLCTGNSARSILGEALFTALGAGRIRGLSAGSAPKGEPHPLALQTLKAHGHDIAGLRSKSWDEFAGPDAPTIDAVITVCDNAAAEVCPVWPGAPVKAHWGLPDPAAIGDPDAARAAFERTYAELERRIVRCLAALGGDDRAALAAALSSGPDGSGEPR
jgi:arsenate reductase